MKKRILYFLAVVVMAGSVNRALGQAGVLDSIDFGKDNWRLFGFEIGSGKLADSLGNFFTRDTGVLKRMQRDWKLSRCTDRCNCPGGYLLLFQNDRGKQIEMDADLEKETLTFFIGPRYNFPRSLLRKEMKNVKRIPEIKYTVNSLDTARMLYKKLEKIDSVHFGAEGDQDWLKYRGQMDIGLYDSGEFIGLDSAVYKRIKQDFKEEEFRVSVSVLAPHNYYEFRIYCSEKMGKSFNTYPVKREWKEFTGLDFHIYGLTKEETDKLVRQNDQ